ncbi:MAG: hypothetical protein U9N09_09905 [Euryarchaeota archaeon]|nr:hypothetical protein [Euryarchaeota archaeon]
MARSTGAQTSRASVGENTIIVTATDREWLTTPAAVTVRYEPYVATSTTTAGAIEL